MLAATITRLPSSSLDGRRSENVHACTAKPARRCVRAQNYTNDFWYHLGLTAESSEPDAISEALEMESRKLQLQALGFDPSQVKASDIGALATSGLDAVQNFQKGWHYRDWWAVYCKKNEGEIAEAQCLVEKQEIFGLGKLDAVEALLRTTFGVPEGKHVTIMMQAFYFPSKEFFIVRKLEDLRSAKSIWLVHK